MMRPMFVEFLEDPMAWNVDTQYMLGFNLMVAPIFNAEGSVQFYVPEGNWYEIIDRKVRTEPKYFTETRDFMSLPGSLLLKPGGAVVMVKPNRSSGGRKLAVYDYASDFIVLVNPPSKERMEIEVELPNCEGDIAALLRVEGSSRTGVTVSVIKGTVRGPWRVRIVNEIGMEFDAAVTTDDTVHVPVDRYFFFFTIWL